MRDKIFISYSHSDAEYLQRLKVHLKPFEKLDKIDIWSDSQIKPGDIWKDEVKKGLDQAAVAILLISADFLASEFIMSNELPNILKAYEEDGVKVIPIILKPCSFKEHKVLSSFQGVNAPSKTIIDMSESEKEKTWYDLSKISKDYIVSLSKKSGDDKKLGALLDDLLGEEKQGIIRHGEGYPEFLESEIDNPDLIDEYYVYSYMHVDYLSFMPLAEQYYYKQFEGYDKIIERVKKKFKSFGWEGDGDIQLLWFPPFVGVGVNDTYGVLTFFVKQGNNGESFICSPVPLSFSRLLEQQWRK